MTMLQSGEATGSAVKDTTTQTFVKDVIEESKRQPVLVDFWAEWCGPCKQLAPVLEKAVRAAKGKVKLVKMDIDKHPTIPDSSGFSPSRRCSPSSMASRSMASSVRCRKAR